MKNRMILLNVGLPRREMYGWFECSLREEESQFRFVDRVERELYQWLVHKGLEVQTIDLLFQYHDEMGVLLNDQVRIVIARKESDPVGKVDLLARVSSFAATYPSLKEKEWRTRCREVCKEWLSHLRESTDGSA